MAHDGDRPVSVASVLRSQPWWQALANLEGAGPARRIVSVERWALQWRVTGSCPRGHLLVRVQGGDDPLIDAPCDASDGIDPVAFRSLVVWCPLIDSAYAAATLELVA